MKGTVPKPAMQPVVACRWLNEELYTSTGQDAFQLMQGNPELFQQYHKVHHLMQAAPL